MYICVPIEFRDCVPDGSEFSNALALMTA